MANRRASVFSSFRFLPFTEEFLDFHSSVVENFLQILLHEIKDEYFPEDSERNLIIHLVSNQGSAVFFFKLAGVFPQGIRAFGLMIGKADGGLPASDFRLPAKGNSVQTEPVVQAGAFLNFFRGLAWYFETKVFRDQEFEIF